MRRLDASDLEYGQVQVLGNKVLQFRVPKISVFFLMYICLSLIDFVVFNLSRV